MYFVTPPATSKQFTVGDQLIYSNCEKIGHLNENQVRVF